jgi:hypothetical protein
MAPNISRGTFSPTKKYDKVILQQGVPWVDADFNEMQDLTRDKIEKIVLHSIGNGSPDTGLQCVGTGAVNNFTIKLGTIFVNGRVIWKEADETYNGQTDWASPTPLTTPGGSRTDTAYLHVFEEVIDSVLDPTIKDPTLAVETSQRIRLRARVEVAEGSLVIPTDTLTDWYYKLATIVRAGGNAQITVGMVTDNRQDISQTISVIDETVKEVNAARGSTISLDTRLSVSLNADGTLKTALRVDILEDGTLKVTDPNELNFTTALNVVDAGGGRATISVDSTAITMPLSQLTDAQIVAPSLNDVLSWNGTKWINAPIINTAASGGVVYFLSDTISTDGNHSLPAFPDSAIEQTDSASVSLAGPATALMDSYITPGVVGGAQIDGGIWEFDLYRFTSNAGGTNTIIPKVLKRVVGTGTLTITGSGTSRTATITGGTPFVAGDANADLTLCGCIETPTATFEISGYTSSSVVTVITPGGYVNEAGVAFALHRYLFSTTTGPITDLTVALENVTTVQPAFTGITATDKVCIRFYARTTANPARTISMLHNGTTHYSHVHTPLITRHNDLVGLQGGSSTERYHLTLSEYTGVGTGDFVRATSLTAASIAVVDAGNWYDGANAELALQEIATRVDLLRPRPQTVPNNTVYVQPGHIVKSNGQGSIFFAGGSSPAFSVVTADSRIDLLTIDDTGTLGIIAGVQSASPAVPTYPTTSQVIAHVLVNETVTVVINTADITDARFFLNLGGGGATFYYNRLVVGTPAAPYSGSTTVFDLNFSYLNDGKSAFVYVDGILMSVGGANDYQETAVNQITFNSALIAGQVVEVRAIVGAAPATQFFEYREDYVVGTPSGNYTGSLTAFDLVNAYVANTDNLCVYLDGVLMTQGASNDYQETSSTRITFVRSPGLVAGQKVSFFWRMSGAAYNAQSVNGISANVVPTANNLLPLNSNSQYVLGSGSASLPSLAIGTTTTGLYYSATQLNVSIAGTLRASFAGTWNGSIQFGGGASLPISINANDINSDSTVRVYNSLTTTPTGVSCSFGLNNKSTTAIGSVNFVKYANGYSGSYTSGLLLTNSWGIIVGGDTIGKGVIDIAGLTGEFYISGNANYYWYWTKTGDLVAYNNGNTVFTQGSFGVRTANGTAGVPSYSFVNDTITGFRRSSANEITVCNNGVDTFYFTTGNFSPWADNTKTCGATGYRWSAIWAGNGVIQTSHSDFKSDIVTITDDIEVPEGIVFNWKDRAGKSNDRRFYGFLADNLPKEAFEWDDAGNILKDGVHESAVVGILCHAVRKLQAELAALKS